MPLKDKEKRHQYENEWSRQKRRGAKGDAVRDYHKEYMQNWRKLNPDKKYDRTYQERLEYNREYNKKNRVRLTARKRAYYEERREYFKQKSRQSYERNRETIAQRAQNLRQEVISHYGGVCVCCGETRTEFLALDHRNNDGASHRKVVKKVYQWAKDNNYPDMLQILCHNCNLAKAFYGACPHERERNAGTIAQSDTGASSEIL
jgi:hypothetical protein